MTGEVANKKADPDSAKVETESSKMGNSFAKLSPEEQQWVKRRFTRDDKTGKIYTKTRLNRRGEPDEK